MKFEDLQNKVLKWANDKDLLHSENADKQFMKFIEEVFEFKTEMDRLTRDIEYCKALNIPFDDTLFDMGNLKLEMGDIFVTLIILCEQIGIDPMDCLSMAYEKIKNRRGKTLHGTFVKEEDL